MSLLKDKTFWIDSLGFLVIGVISFLYILFGVSFAESHLEVPGLDFPIFVSEMALAACLVLYFMKLNIHSIRIRGWELCILAYFIFVISKTLIGYYHWGPLALRNGMLLFYPIFILLAYSFFRLDWFSRSTVLISLIALIIATFVFERYNDYWTLSLFYLALVLILRLPARGWQIFFLACLFLSLPYHFLFKTARMMILGNTISWLFFCVAIIFIVPARLQVRLAIFIAAIFLFGFGIYRMADPGRTLSIVRLDVLSRVVADFEQQVTIHKKDFQLSQNRTVRLYNPNTEESQRKNEILLRNLAVVINDIDAELEALHIGIQGEENDRKEALLNLESLNQMLKDEYRQVEEEVRLIINRSGTDRASQSEHHVHKRLNGLSKVSDLILGYIRGFKETNREAKEDLQKLTVLRAKPIEKLISDFNKEATPEKKPRFELVDQNPEILNNAVFRIFIWKDMFEELLEARPILGFGFGKPLRSKRLESLDWGASEWARDGWVAAHNSYFHIIYRAGIVGLAFLLTIMGLSLKMTLYFLRNKLIVGVLLIAILIIWFVAANFLVILEMPYTAIPIWSLYGITLYYYQQHRQNHQLSGQDI